MKIMSRHDDGNYIRIIYYPDLSGYPDIREHP